ncbi:MAG: iron-containing alcohol dehydrogenase [Bacteroidetes bacterium]|nr:iron-containing alcohol dehydrogenase [Bacteroidota bacterium]
MIKFFDAQKIYSRIEDIEDILAESGASRVMLVTGKQSYELSKAKVILDKILIRYSVVRHFEFRLNPELIDLVDGAETVNDFKPDVLIAVGGGSVIDTAKLILTLQSNYEDAKMTVEGQRELLERNCMFIAVPTTAGSGSECTHFAVAYVGSTKYSVAHKSLLPDIVILDPTLTYSMSAYLSAVTGMDALSQAIESYWAIGATNESKSYAKRAIENILEVFPKVINSPDAMSRKKMQQGAYNAGRAINISKTTAPHSLAYILTYLYNIPHGHAVALTLPFFFEYNMDEYYSTEQTRKNLCSIMNCKTIKEGSEKLEHIIIQAGLETKLSNLGASNKNDICKIVSGVNLERLNNNPRYISEKDLTTAIEHIW